MSDPAGDEQMREGGLRSGIRAAAAGQEITADALVRAMGGVRGIVESVLPGLAFLVVYTFTAQLLWSLVAPVVIGVAALVVRLVRREPVLPALSGLGATAVCVALSLLTGRAQEFFVLGFWIDGLLVVVLLVSVLARRPLVGIIVGFLVEGGAEWVSSPRVIRLMRTLTLVWLALFAARLVVQLPLYLLGEVTWLGVTRLLMGVPLYGLLLVATWLVVRAAFAVGGRPGGAEGESGSAKVS